MYFLFFWLSNSNDNQEEVSASRLTFSIGCLALPNDAKCLVSGVAKLAGFWLNVTEEGAAQAGEEVPVVLLVGELVFSAIEPSLRRYGQA